MIVFEEKRGVHLLRAERDGAGYKGVACPLDQTGEMLHDDDLDRLKRRLRRHVAIQDPHYFGMTGAVQRFLSIFPAGFQDPRYLRKERAYKIEASKRLAGALTLVGARTATTDQAASLWPAFNTGSLHEPEAMRIGQVLSGPTAADFVRGAARFADGRYSEGLRAMEIAVRPYGKATWPMVTYLAWLWLPQDHVYLTPGTCRDFASRIGHDFAHEYESGLFSDVYRSMQDLAEMTRAEISRLGPADMIDVQSFIWVIGRYAEAATLAAE